LKTNQYHVHVNQRKYQLQLRKPMWRTGDHHSGIFSSWPGGKRSDIDSDELIESEPEREAWECASAHANELSRPVGGVGVVASRTTVSPEAIELSVIHFV
jgi:hypothetical protein